jgi:Fe-S-cluster-containing dehydrogenase component
VRTWVERYVATEDGVASTLSTTTAIGPLPAGLAENAKWAAFVPKLCNHCEEAPCVQVCPVGATFNAPGGFVLVDPKHCIGCGYCIQACPYGVRFFNKENRIADKCTWCYHRVSNGLQPACVTVCPTGARQFGDRNDPASPVAQVYRSDNWHTLKPEMHTLAGSFILAYLSRGGLMLPNGALDNFYFPNEAHIDWSLMIVIYPYITGLVAGAFVLSALYHVFKVKEFESIARLALVASFCFGLFAAVPLLVHLGQPQRAFNIFFTPHTTSAMSIFGYIYSSYMILLMMEMWLVYRRFFIEKARNPPRHAALCVEGVDPGRDRDHPRGAQAR